MIEITELQLCDWTTSQGFRTKTGETRITYLTSADARLLVDLQSRLVFVLPHDRGKQFAIPFELVRAMDVPPPASEVPAPPASDSKTDAEIDALAALLCDTCGQGFKSKSALRSHVRSKHKEAA